MLLRFHDVSKSFGSHDVLRNVSFEIHSGQKVGLIGSNGTGKTTLLRLTESPDEVDSGSVHRGAGLRTGWLDQIPDFGDETVLGEALRSFDNLRLIEERLRVLEGSMAEESRESILNEYSTLQQEFEFQGGYSFRSRTEAALMGVGFSRSQFTQPASSLSGGEQNRLALARLLLDDVDLLLLDEPTNHLDIRSIEWLEHFLKETDKALLIVSHDRFFLDRVVTRIFELERGRLLAYTGNYTFYLSERRKRRESEERAWKAQQEGIQRTEDYIRRNLAGQKTKQAQSRRKALERLDRLERPVVEPRAAQFDFRPATSTGRHLLTASGLSVGYRNRLILENLNLTIERQERWAIVGPNGSGKTTLLESLIGRLPLLGGEIIRDAQFRVGYYDQRLAGLDSARSLLEELRTLDSEASDGQLRSFLARFLFRGEDVFRQVGRLSGGEKSRLALAKLVYSAPPLLALDEPTNHLDIGAREALETALSDYSGSLLFVTHDRRLVERIATHILYLDPGDIQKFDDFDRFERWLGRNIDMTQAPEKRPRSRATQATSKNRRAQIEARIRRLETTIEATEAEIKSIESLFQEPPPDLEWAVTNQRYSQLKAKVESLYDELAEGLEQDSSH